MKKFVNQTEADKYYLMQSYQVSLTSDDPKSKRSRESGVGSIIANKDGEISRSANVIPPELKNHYKKADIELDESDRYFVLEHAERAALYKAYNSKAELEGATLYCTRFPCSDCARAIAWSPIKRIVVPRGFKGEVKWLEAQRASLRILRGSGIIIRYLPIEPDDSEAGKF